MDIIKSNLEILKQLFIKYNYEPGVKHLEEFIAIYSEDKKEFFNSFINKDWWGTYWILCDYHLIAKDKSITNNENIADNEQQQKSLIEIYDEMVKYGYKHPKIEDFISVFKHWKEIDVYKK